MDPQLLADAHVLADTVSLQAGSGILDPMYWLSSGGPFGAAILPALLTVLFIETGLFFPLLPGDSLLFTSGMLTQQDDPFAPLWLVLVLCPIAAFLGNQAGYWIGHFFGDKLRERPDGRIFKQKYLTEAHEFAEKWGSATIILCQFVPIVRTYAPLTLGISRMPYRKYLPFSILGVLLWTVGVTLLGVWLGQYEFVRTHIDAILIGVVLVSVIPIALTAFARWRGGRRDRRAATEG